MTIGRRMPVRPRVRCMMVLPLAGAGRVCVDGAQGRGRPTMPADARASDVCERNRLLSLVRLFEDVVLDPCPDVNRESLDAGSVFPVRLAAVVQQLGSGRSA